MRRLKTLSTAILAPLLLLDACASHPMGPTVAVMPAPGKPFDVFQSDQALCKQFADQQVEGGAQSANNRQVGTAVIGTLLGAGLGAAAGARRSVPARARWAVPRWAPAPRDRQTTACSSATISPIPSACIPAATRCLDSARWVCRPRLPDIRHRLPGIRRPDDEFPSGHAIISHSCLSPACWRAVPPPHRPLQRCLSVACPRHPSWA